MGRHNKPSDDANDIHELVDKINEQQQDAGRETTVTQPKDDD
jgi:hypothetical protein